MNTKKIFVSALAALFACGTMSIAAMAQEAEVDYVASEYITVDETENTITLAAGEITAEADGESAISILKDDYTIIVNGDVTLTGAKGGAGIYVAEGASVTIKGEGTLTAIGNAGDDNNGSGAAGIGGTRENGNSGAITIDGATVVAKGYGVHGSGIGSGYGGISGKIEIKNDADVIAYGGYYADGAGTTFEGSYGSSEPEGSAAIGGGAKTNGVIGDIVISDSTVNAYGGSKAAAIGCAFWSSCDNITIKDSKITAQGGGSSAAIGTSRAGSNGVYANITIEDSEINATGGKYGAAIGGGYNGDSLKNLPESEISISGGEINAVGGEAGAGIGGGYKTNNLEITISDNAEITAVAGVHTEKNDPAQNSASAIGSGANGSGTFVGSTIAIDETVKVEATTNGGKPAVEILQYVAPDAEEGTKPGTNDATVAGEINVTVKSEQIAENHVAAIGAVGYETLEDALTEAKDGDTIVLLADAATEGENVIDTKVNLTIDLNGHTLTPAAHKSTFDQGTGNIRVDENTLTIKNGTIDVAGIEGSKHAIMLVDGGKLVLANVSVTGSNYNSKYAVIYMVAETSKVEIYNSEVKLENALNGSEGFVKGEGGFGSVLIDNSDISLDNIQRAFVSTDVEIVNGSEISVKNNQHAFNICNVVVDASTVTVTDCADVEDGEYVDGAIKLAADNKFEVSGGSKVTLSNNERYDIYFKSSTEEALVIVDADSTLLSDSTNGTSANFNIAEGSESVIATTKITVNFVVNKDDENVYDIVLAGYNGAAINRLNSADLEFVLTTQDDIAYEIVDIADDNIAVNPVNNSTDRYEFHFETKTDVENDTAEEITIGKVKFTGYGKATFGVKTNDTNAAHATTTIDNIVESYVPAGAEVDDKTDVIGELVLPEAITVEFFAPTQNLTVNLTFPNAIENKASYTYQQMKVTVSGGDLDENIVVELGKDTVIPTLALSNRPEAAVKVSDVYTVVLEKALTANTSYTVTVEGAGYRTARYTVNTQETDRHSTSGTTLRTTQLRLKQARKQAQIPLPSLQATLSRITTSTSTTFPQ